MHNHHSALGLVRDLKPVEPGVYIGEVDAPKKGFTAYFVELTYDVGASFPLKVTTEIRVTPNEYPFKGMKASDAKVGGVPKQHRDKKKDK